MCNFYSNLSKILKKNREKIEHSMLYHFLNLVLNYQKIFINNVMIQKWSFSDLRGQLILFE